MKSYLFILSLFLSTYTYAGVYKCVDKKGKTSFQSIPCPMNTEKKIMKLHKDKIPRLTQCQSSCDSDNQVCIASMENGMWNTDGGLDLCQEEKKTCYVTCVNPGKGKSLKIFADYDRARYQSNLKYKKSIADIDNKYQMKKEARELKWECSEKSDSLTELESDWLEKKQGSYTTSELSFYRRESEEIKKFIGLNCE